MKLSSQFVKPAHLSALALLRSCTVAAVLVAAASASADHYKVTDLGTLAGQAHSWNWQQTINNRGVVAEYCNNTLNPDAYSGDESYLFKDGSIIPLPGLTGSTDTIAFALNDFDQVVGRSTPSGAANQPVMWNHGSIKALPLLGGDNKGADLMINDWGTSVGYSASTVSGIRRAAIWSPWGDVYQLPSLPTGGGFDEALGINNFGEAAGWSGFTIGGGDEHIALWRNGTVQDLGTLGGAFGDGYAINDEGQMVGQSANATNPNGDAFFWDRGKLTDLGTLSGDVFSCGLGLNDLGQAAGFSGSDPNTLSTWHAVIWQHGSTLVLQNEIPANSGWQLLAASGVNNRGQIDGIGIHNGLYRGFLLTPTDGDGPALAGRVVSDTMEGYDWKAAALLQFRKLGHATEAALGRKDVIERARLFSER